MGFVILLTDIYRMVVSLWPCCIDLSTLNSPPLGTDLAKYELNGRFNKLRLKLQMPIKRR